MEILRHGTDEKCYAYFICSCCGCEFKKRKGDCDRRLWIGSSEPVCEPCPDCGTMLMGMTRNDYLSEVRSRSNEEL